MHKKARSSILGVLRFSLLEGVILLYVKYIVKKSFHAVWVRNNFVPLPEAGFIGIANHDYWWDGLLLYFWQPIHRPTVPFAVLVDRSVIAQLPLVRFIGAFAAGTKDYSGIRELVEYMVELAQNGAGVWVFPGQRDDSAHSCVKFQRGFAHVARSADVPVVTAGLRLTIRLAQRPEALLQFGEHLDTSTGLFLQGRDAVERLVEILETDVNNNAIERNYKQVTLGAPTLTMRLMRILGTCLNER